MAHAKRLPVEQIAQRNDLTFEPCIQLDVDPPAFDRFAELLRSRMGLCLSHRHPSVDWGGDLAGRSEAI
jgi:hypothetical protein